SPSSFFCDATATPQIYTLSLHDALPISARRGRGIPPAPGLRGRLAATAGTAGQTTRPGRRRGQRDRCPPGRLVARPSGSRRSARSEEHTSELQSRENLVCRLLLEKKKEK